MEKSDAKPKVDLSVNINCCDACSQKVKKLLLKVKGVESVDLDRAKRLVSVTGKADPKLLIKAVGKMRKKAKVVPNKATKEKEEKAKKTSKKEKEENANKPAEVDDNTANGGFDPEICRDRFCLIHRRPGMIHYPPMPVYRPMPPPDYYPPPAYYPPPPYGYPAAYYPFRYVNAPYYYYN